MDIDPPSLLTSSLKRSSSAPMINVLGNSPSTREHNYTPSPLLLSIPRTRRFSASFSPGQCTSSPHSPSSALPSRVSQIKHEEGMDMMCRETAHEKEVQSKLQISQSWEDLALDDNVISDSSKRPRSLTDPLHIFTSPFGSCNSPSPTRAGKQCFSPSTCLSVRPGSLSTSPIPSPTRKAFATRRSQSPIALRPSHFASKRKFDIEMESISSPAKRLNLGPSSIDSPTRSLSAASLDAINSPEQTVPQEADITDSMSTSSGSPCNSFKPLEPAPTTNNTQQENHCRMDVSSI